MIDDKTIVLQDNTQKCFLFNFDNPNKGLLLSDKEIFGSLTTFNNSHFLLEVDKDILQFNAFQRISLLEYIQSLPTFSEINKIRELCII